MPKVHSTWTVLEHGPIKPLEENLWHVTGKLPNIGLKRRMTIARTANGWLAIHSAIAMNDESMKALEALGQPRWLLVPNGWHRLDAPSYKRRYPQLIVLTPTGSRKKVEEVVAVDGDYSAFPNDPDIALLPLEGVKGMEGVVRIRSAKGITLVFNDLVFNLPHTPGLMGWVFRMMGSTGGPRITRLMKMLAVKDKASLRRQLEGLSKEPGVIRLIPGHGSIIDQEAPLVLRRIADAL